MKVAGCGLRFWSVPKYHGTRIDTARVERLEEVTVLVELIDGSGIRVVAGTHVDVSAFLVYFEQVDGG